MPTNKQKQLERITVQAKCKILVHLYKYEYLSNSLDIFKTGGTNDMCTKIRS